MGHFVHSSSRKLAESPRKKQGLPVLSAARLRAAVTRSLPPRQVLQTEAEGEQEGRPSGRSARRRTSCWGHGAWGGASPARGKSGGRPGRQPGGSAPTCAVLGCAMARLGPMSRPASACASRPPAEPRPRAGCRGGRWVSPRDGRGPLLPAAQKRWPCSVWRERRWPAHPTTRHREARSGHSVSKKTISI